METLRMPKLTKAIKEHRCNFCSIRIPKGDTYMRSTHTYEGMIYEWKSHTWCEEIVNRLKMHESCDEGVTQNDFMEIISDEYHNLTLELLHGIEQKRCNELIKQLFEVNFKHKLDYVIRHYKKIDNQTI
jgi:hypothetical protein